MTTAKIELQGVGKRYPGTAAPAVANLDLQIPEGEIVVLVGPSGCGKSTTLRLINRMIEPTSGRIVFDGEDVTGVNPDILRRRIGYVIQQIGLFPHLTIAENVATVPKLLRWDRDRIRARVDELLALVQLDPDETRDRYPAQLSGGQRQRVGVARALAVDPPLMLMDEPFGAIDPINREKLQNEFLRLQREIRKTIVFVTHDIDEAIKMGDRIAILRKGGRLAQYAPPAELLMEPADRFVEDFVGADRALKRLALQRVRDIDLWRAPLARAGDPVASVRAQTAACDLPYPLLVDEAGRPLGWLSEAALAGETVTADLVSDPQPIVELDDVLRDALSDLLQHESQYGPVVDARGAVAGVLSIEAIGHALRDSDAVPRAADAAVEG